MSPPLVLPDAHADSIPPYTVTVTRRKTLAVFVYADGSVEVRTPKRVSRRRIKTFVRERRAWILTQQERFKELPQPVEKRYVSGETHRFLGEALTLTIEPDLVNRVARQGSQLEIRITRYSAARVKRLIDEWYAYQAEAIFHERLRHCLAYVAPLGIHYRQPLHIRRMRSRWGSCTAKGKITLSRFLVEEPIAAIDYVITHELCHLRELNHSKAFYALMDQAMPEWKKHKAQLSRGVRRRDRD